MKKFSKLLMVFLLVASLTGCVKYNASMEIGEDKSVKLEIIYGMELSEDMFDTDAEPSEDDDWSYDSDDDWSYDSDDDWSYDDEEDEEESSSGVNVEDYKYLEDKGFKVEEFEEKKDDTTVSGVKITKTYKNIDDITKDKKIVVDFNKMFDTENAESFDDSQYFSKNGSTYVANFLFDFSEEDLDSSTAENYDKMMDLTYKVILPSESESNNATSVSEDGKTLTWDLKYGAKNEVNFEFKLGTNLLPIILVVVGVVAVVAVVVVLVVMKKKKNNGMPNNGGMPVANAAPMGNGPVPMANDMPVVNNPAPMDNNTPNMN